MQNMHESKVTDYAKEFTLEAIKTGALDKTDGAQFAENVAAFFNTVVKELTPDQNSASEKSR